MKKVLCFGELLLRISPFVNNPDPFTIYVGGAEANVARALANFEMDVEYCTALPENFMSTRLKKYLNDAGVGTEKILYTGNRIGIYYLDQGADLKGAVVYDRAGSSFSKLMSQTIDWDQVFDGIEWFNFSAITPAINQNLADICVEAVQAASKKNIKVSIDLNYRSRLWMYTDNPVEIMRKILPYCNLVMGNIWSAHTLLGISIDLQIHEKLSRQAYLEESLSVSKAIMQLYPSCNIVANTFRFDEAATPIYYTTLYNGADLYESSIFNISKIEDKSGSGDCFMAGLIYGIMNYHPLQQILNFATAAAVGKLQERGDGTKQNINSVLSTLNDNS